MIQDLLPLAGPYFLPWLESESEVAQSCPTLCNRKDCSLPGSSNHGIFQAIVLEWVAICFSRGSSRPGDQTQVSLTVDRRFTVWATLVRWVQIWGSDQELLLYSWRYYRICCKSNRCPTKILNSLAKVVHGNGTALGYLLAEHEGACAVANSNCWTWVNTPRGVETQQYKITEQATWLNKVTVSTESVFDLFQPEWFGSWGPWLQNELQILRTILIITIVSLVCCILSKALSECSQLLTTKQVLSLPKTGISEKEWREWPT